MNYTTATPWSRLIEVQGFGGSYFRDATGATAGSVAVSANQVSRYITFSVDKTALGGTPATGWAFAVTLTGQDGTHGTDQTRGFASTPQAFAFGVCAVGGSAPICSEDPNSVPKVMDLMTPSGVSQATELSTTPVVVQSTPLSSQVLTATVGGLRDDLREMNSGPTKHGRTARAVRLGSCRKLGYRDSITAKLALASARRADGSGREKLEKRAYRCPQCHLWHLTSRA
jgi:hypothetical protein